MKNRFDGCSLMILGDSYSTFAGHNPAGQDVYYPNETIGVTDVEQTWWRQFIARHQMPLLTNDSWSGATVCTSVRPEHPVSAAFVRRMQETLNGTVQPDLVILFGGTNDSWTDCVPGALQPSDWTEADDQTVLPAFCHMMAYVREKNPAAHVVCILNTDMSEAITSGAAEACRMFGVQCVQLHDIDKIWGHPTPLGMRQIADQLDAALEEA